MKKYLLLTLLLVSGMAVAQQAGILNNKTIKKSVNGNQKVNRNKLTTSGTVERWYSYANSYENFFGQKVARLNANYLFPDSTVIIKNNDSSFSSPWIHSLGVVIDLQAPPFKDLSTISNNFFSGWPYTIDSLSTSGIYTRVSDSSIVDTLIIKLYEAHPNTVNLNNRSYFYNIGINSNLKSDTVFFVNFNWDFSSLKASGAFKEIKVLMDDNFFLDTNVGGLHQIDVAVKQSMPITPLIPNIRDRYYGNIGITYDFKPGYLWNANIDTLGLNVNSWKFLSWKLNGDSTYQNYNKDDWNASYIIPTSVRYNNASGWNNAYIPSYAFMNTTPDYKYEAHESKLKVSQNVGNTIEIVKIDFSVYPNPNSGYFNLRFGNISHDTYSIKILSLLGQEVYKTQVEASANQVETFNFNNLDKGVYLLSISGNGMNTVQRVILK